MGNQIQVWKMAKFEFKVKKHTMAYDYYAFFLLFLTANDVV